MAGTAPTRTLGTARTYHELHALLRARADELEVSRLDLDALAGIAAGYSSTLLAPAKKKKLGPVSLGPLLAALGLKLLVAEDEQTIEQARHRIVKRQAQHVRAGEHHWRNRDREWRPSEVTEHTPRI